MVKSEPYQITVTPAEEGSNNTAPSGSSGSTSRPSSNDPTVSGKDLFFKVVPSKRTAYVGEPVVLTYKLYTRVPVSQLTVSKMPSYGGFWMKEVGDNSSTLRQTNEVVNGIEYTVAEVKKVVLIPQKAANLIIESMGIDCIAQIQTQRNNQRSNDPFDIFFNDPFFNRGITNVQKNLETAVIDFETKSLPTTGKPDGFSGAVGNYNFSTSLDLNEVSTNEAVTLTVTVSGSGNLELLNMPKPVFPPDFEVYDPKIISNIDANGQGMSGTKKAEYLVIPRRAGDFTIPPMEFSFFNPSKGQYVTLRSQQHQLHVSKGADDSGDGNVYASTQEGIKHLGSDIRHIMTGRPGLRPLNSAFFASPGYFLILAAALLLFVVILLLVRRQRQFRQDVVNVFKKAVNLAELAVFLRVNFAVFCHYAELNKKIDGSSFF